MGFWSKTGKTVGAVVNYRVDKWVGAEGAKNIFSYFKDVAVSLVEPVKAKENLSFEEACQKLGLTEHDLKLKLTEFRKYAITYAIASILMFAYSIFIVTHGNIGGFCIGTSITIYGLANSFRYHFWMFQIKHRKLGCTLKEWFNSSLG